MRVRRVSIPIPLYLHGIHFRETFYPEVCTWKIAYILKGNYKYQNCIVYPVSARCILSTLMCIKPPLFVLKINSTILDTQLLPSVLTPIPLPHPLQPDCTTDATLRLLFQAIYRIGTAPSISGVKIINYEKNINSDS